MKWSIKIRKAYFSALYVMVVLSSFVAAAAAGWKWK